MRYLMVILVALSLLFGSLAVPVQARGRLTPAQKSKIEQRVKNLSRAQRQAAAQGLNAKLKRLRDNIKASQITARRRALINAEIERIENELELINAVGQAAPPPPPPPPPPMIKQMPPMPRPTQGQMLRQRSPQVGVSAGYLAGIPGAVAEVRFHDPFDMVRTSIRFGAGYAQGDDTAGTLRKHALVIVDGIYRLNPPQAEGLRSYIGLGLNYNVYTTGRVSGAAGYQAFYGIEGGRPDGGQMFFEVGYGSIQTGFSPDYTGLTAQVGYKF
ncbi:MAG: hypothetical protein KJ732_07845 [Candidatus Margulisbacteria bacterium]|nr:hypothetical protein [Candidatus Margulisiibacteriota bacterium]